MSFRFFKNTSQHTLHLLWQRFFLCSHLPWKKVILPSSGQANFSAQFYQRAHNFSAGNVVESRVNVYCDIWLVF